VRERFTHADPLTQIAAEMERVEERLRAHRPSSVARPALYLFFITNRLRSETSGRDAT
jgi:hypothetical protein